MAQKGSPQIIILGIVGVFILAGTSGFLSLQKQKTPLTEKQIQEEELSVTKGTMIVTHGTEEKTESSVEKLPQSAPPPISQTSASFHLGTLCSGKDECINFCLNNRGRCEQYCTVNSTNELCPIVFPAQLQKQPQTLQNAAGTTCVSDPSPLFTAPFTDATKILEVTEIGSNALYNPGSQARSYVAIKNGEIVPVYAPVDATLKRIYYSNKNYPNLVRPEYRLDFQVSCEVSFAFDHITSIADALKAHAPQVAAAGRNDGVQVEIPIKAGDLLGHTSGTVQAGTWDFVFLNTARVAYHINQARWTTDNSKHADCPYDYFTDDLKNTYYALIPKIDGEAATCGPSVRDVPDTIAGYWFKGDADETQGERFGINSTKHFVQFVLARADGSFVFVRDTNPSRVALGTVTPGKSACYYDNEKNSFAFLKLISSDEVGVVTGSGACPSIFPEQYGSFVR